MTASSEKTYLQDDVRKQEPMVSQFVSMFIEHDMSIMSISLWPDMLDIPDMPVEEAIEELDKDVGVIDIPDIEDIEDMFIVADQM